MEKINTRKKNKTNIVFKVSRLSNFKFCIFKTFKFCRSIDNFKGTFKKYVCSRFPSFDLLPSLLVCRKYAKKKKIMDSAKKRMEICGSKSVQKNQSSFMKTAF